MLFIELDTMPFDRCDENGNFVHATGYAAIIDDRRVVMYEDYHHSTPIDGDTVISEEMYHAIKGEPSE